MIHSVRVKDFTCINTGLAFFASSKSNLLTSSGGKLFDGVRNTNTMENMGNIQIINKEKRIRTSENSTSIETHNQGTKHDKSHPFLYTKMQLCSHIAIWLCGRTSLWLQGTLFLTVLCILLNQLMLIKLFFQYTNKLNIGPPVSIQTRVKTHTTFFV